MKFNFSSKKPETEKERVIRYADTIVAHSNFKGELNNECLDPLLEFWVINLSKLPDELMSIRNEIFSLQPKNNDGTTVNVDITKKCISDNYSTVRNHLLNYGYIDSSGDSQRWVLNEDGKKMKQLKGHNKYQEYIDKKLKSEIAEMNGKIYWKKRVFISAVLSLIAGLLVGWIIGLFQLQTPKPKSPSETQLSTPATQLEKTDSTNHK